MLILGVSNFKVKNSKALIYVLARGLLVNLSSDSQFFECQQSMIAICFIQILVIITIFFKQIYGM